MKHILEITSKILFCIILTVACLTTNSNNLSGYFGSMGTMLIIFKLLIVFVFVFIITYENRSNIKFVSIAEPIIVCITTAMLIFDYYVTQYSGTQFLFTVWWIISIFIAQAGVFVGITLSSDKANYKAFYKRFWIGFTPMYIFLLFLCFARTPFSSNFSINTKLGQGTFTMLIAFINNLDVSFEAPLIFFGNLLVFVPIAFILNATIKKIKLKHIIIIGTALPFLIEGYQYIFKCGDVDIDDIVLNLIGFYIGAMLMSLLSKKLIKK